MEKLKQDSTASLKYSQTRDYSVCCQNFSFKKEEKSPGLDKMTKSLAMIALSAVQSSAETSHAILYIDTSNNAWYIQAH